MSFLRHEHELGIIRKSLEEGAAQDRPLQSNDNPSHVHQGITWAVALQQSRPPFPLVQSMIGRRKKTCSQMREIPVQMWNRKISNVNTIQKVTYFKKG